LNKIDKNGDLFEHKNKIRTNLAKLTKLGTKKYFNLNKNS